MSRTFRLIVLLTVLFLVPARESRGQSLITDTIALLGDPVPDSERTITTLGEAAIDASGRIVFRGNILRFGSTLFFIFQSTRTGAGIIRMPGAAPGFTNDMGEPSSFGSNASAPIVNAAGTLAFTSSVSDNPTVLFRGTSVTSLSGIARTDTLNLPGFPEPSILAFVLNASGTAALLAGQVVPFSGGGLISTAVDEGGVFITAGGAPTRIAVDGEQAPGTPTGAVFRVFFPSTLVINAQGDVAFIAGLEVGAGGVTLNDNRGIWLFSGGSLRLVAREGDEAPGTGDREAFTGFGGLSISPTGEVAFTGSLPSGGSRGLWRGTGPADLRAVAVRDVPVPTGLGFSDDLLDFSAPVFTKAGDLLFRARGHRVTDAIWVDDGEVLQTIVRGPVVDENQTMSMPGDVAPGTGGTFLRFGEFVPNGEGRIAFRATHTGTPLGPLFQGGVWAEDSSGVPHLVGQKGDTIQTRDGARTISNIFFLSGRGNVSGYGSGFGDNFELAVRIDFQEGGAGIFRAVIDTVEPPPVIGDEFFWSGACGNDDWHAQCGGITNWNDANGEPQPSPPGDTGEEIVTICDNVPVDGVILEQRDVQINKLDACGKLVVRKSLTINQESTVESLILDSLESQIIANAKLTLTGHETVFQAGTLTINSDDGIVNEGTVTVEPFALTIPNGLAGSKTDVHVTAKSRQPQSQAQGTTEFVLEGDGVWSNTEEIVQLGDILVKGHVGKTAILNAKGAKWTIEKGSLLFGSEGEAPKFINEGALSKNPRDATDESFIDLKYEQKGDGEVLVDSGTLTFRGGGTFQGQSGVIFPGGFDLRNTSTLRLGSPPNANRALYEVLSGTVKAGNPLGEAVSQVFAVDNAATLSISAGATFLAQLVGSPDDSDRGGFELNDGGELRVAGVFRNEKDFTWRGGKITTSDATGGAALFNNHCRLSIEGQTPKTLVGRLVNRSSAGDPFREGLVDLRGTLTLASGAELENEAAPTVGKESGLFLIFDDGAIAAAGSGAVFKNKAAMFVGLSHDATTDMTATIAVRFDNTGTVFVSKRVLADGVFGPPPATQTLRLTGDVTQLPDTSLTGGTWRIRSKGVLDLGGRTIKQLGDNTGKGAGVLLIGDGRINQFELEKIEKNSWLRQKGGSLIFPGALDVAGRLEIFDTLDIDCKKVRGIRIYGDFDQRGKFILGGGSSSDIDCIDPQFQVLSGNVTFHERSETIINGDFFVTNGHTITVRGDLTGGGTINRDTDIPGVVALAVEQGGTITVGKSPGTLTIEADYTQSADGTLVIEIGGTDVGTNQDQLVINGNADIGGTLSLKFIDDFSPQAGQTFDFLIVSGSQTGQFENVEIVDLAPGFEFDVTRTEGGMMMTAMSDGVFTGIVGEINAVNLGPAPPETETTALLGDVNVPMLQFEVVPEADGLSISSLTLKAGGSGNDAADLTSVTVWVDENSNGQVDPQLPAVALPADGEDGNGNGLIAEGDRQIGSGTYDADNGTLNLTIDPPLEVPPRETATLLVTYDIAGGEAGAGANAEAQALNDTTVGGCPILSKGGGQRLSLGLSAITFPLLIALTLGLALSLRLVTTRRYRATALVFTCMLTAAWIVGCPPEDMIGPGPGPGPTTVTFRVTLTGIEAQETGTGQDASVDNLSLTGTNLTVTR